MNTETRKYDIILWGATSFVGKLIAEHMLNRFGCDGDVKWAIAGRNKSKLNSLIESLGLKSDSLDVYVGDCEDQDFLNDLASKTKVVITTVGPYIEYGEKLVRACAQNGTDYCDLTGEIPFVKQMLNKYHNIANQTGARIMHCCGVDSVPSDLGVYFTNKRSLQKFNEPVNRVKCFIKKFKGGFSGGTVASIRKNIEWAKKHKSEARQLANPYLICKNSDSFGKPRQPGNFAYYFNKHTGKWVSSFLMSGVNTKIVHASNELLHYPYSDSFLYDEKVMCKNKFKAMLNYYRLGFFIYVLSIKYLGDFVANVFLPKPGEGPSDEVREAGGYEYLFIGTTSSGNKIECNLKANKDPGYGSTAMIIPEVALLLAEDHETRKIKSGFVTPAILGDALIDRLAKYSQLKYE